MFLKIKFDDLTRVFKLNTDPESKDMNLNSQ